jgi:diacylglycerol kinase family enzyme
VRANERTALIIDPASTPDPATLVQGVAGACAAEGRPRPFVRTLCRGDDGTAQARQAVRDGCGLVLVAGQGRTVRAVAQEVVGTPTVLGIIPTGSDDLLARNLDIPCDPAAALRVALCGGERRLDVGRLADGTIFTVVAGTGWGPVLPCLSPRDRTGSTGPSDLFRRWRRLRSQERRIWISLDRAPALAVTVTNVLVGNLDCFGPHEGTRSAPDDGLLDVGLVPALPRRGGKALLCGGAAEPPIRILPARTIEIRLSSVQPRQVDGAPLSPDASLLARIVPQGLSVRVPAA